MKYEIIYFFRETLQPNGIRSSLHSADARQFISLVFNKKMRANTVPWSFSIERIDFE